MKSRFLIIALCFICAASHAQTKKPAPKKGAGKTVTKPKPGAAKPKPTATPDTIAKNTLPASSAPKTADVPKKPVVTGPILGKDGKPFVRPVDGYFIKNDVINAKVTPMATLREADVVYSRRIWREFDLREKMNQYMASPKARLIDVLID